MGRLWLFSRGFTVGALLGGALIVHFTHRQVSAADFEVQHSLEELAALETHVANRGAAQLRDIAQNIARQTDLLHAASAARK